MSQDLHTEPGPSATQLLSGILSDAQDLMRQQLALLRAEVREDIQKTREAAILLTSGVAVALAAVLLLCFMLVYLLADSLPTWPLWASFGAVGGGLALIAAILAGIAIVKFRSFNPLPDQTVNAAKENVRWIANPK